MGNIAAAYFRQEIATWSLRREQAATDALVAQTVLDELTKLYSAVRQIEEAGELRRKAAQLRADIENCDNVLNGAVNTDDAASAVERTVRTRDCNADEAGVA